MSVRNPNPSKRKNDDSPTIKRQKLPCNNKMCDKQSNTSNKIFFENTEKMNNEPTNLTNPHQFDDSEPINFTLSPELECYEPMTSIEKDATRNNWWDNKISLLCCNCSAENILNPNENGFTYWNCCEKCIVARPCCSREDNQETDFTVSVVFQTTTCLLCYTNMNYLTCCKEFVAVNIENDILNCVKCHKLFI